MKPDAFGLLASFPSQEAFLAALRTLVGKGHRGIETYTPHAVAEEAVILRRRPSPVSWIMLGAGIAGGAGAFFLQAYASRDYPLNVGGRPLGSWPSFVPVTFELTVLAAALTGVAALLWLTGLPRLDHPAFADRGFLRASQDRYFICLRADAPGYSEKTARADLLGLKPESVEVLPA